MQKFTNNVFLVGSFLSWDGSKLRPLYTHRFICCFCVGVFFCKHTPSVLSSWYVVCGTIPSTCLKWNSMNTLIFVINKDLSFFYICHLCWECRIFECQKMVKSTDTCVLARHVANMSANMSATWPKTVSANVLTMLSWHVAYGYVSNMSAYVGDMLAACNQVK